MIMSHTARRCRSFNASASFGIGMMLGPVDSDTLSPKVCPIESRTRVSGRDSVSAMATIVGGFGNSLITFLDRRSQIEWCTRSPLRRWSWRNESPVRSMCPWTYVPIKGMSKRSGCCPVKTLTQSSAVTEGSLFSDIPVPTKNLRPMCEVLTGQATVTDVRTGVLPTTVLRGVECRLTGRAYGEDGHLCRRLSRHDSPKGLAVRLLSAELLRVLIRERDLSHRALAAAVGCSAGFISHLTAGRRTSCTADLASAIAEELDVPVALLFAPSLSVSARQNAAGDAA